MPLKYAMIGYGRMGRAVDVQASERGHERVAVVDLDAPDAQTRIERDGLVQADVAFEFTVAGAAEDNLLALVRAGISVVCGTTGWEPSAILRTAVDASSVGVVLAPNFSVGVNLFFRIVDHAARVLATLGLHDPFIQEAHHRGKLDAPSGTARRLASIVLDADPRLHRVQAGNPPGVLPADTLQVSSTRAGVEPGAHLVGFDGAHDLVTLQHRARGREGFALGAVLAAEWLDRQAARGWHTFESVLSAILAEGGSREL